MAIFGSGRCKFGGVVGGVLPRVLRQTGPLFSLHRGWMGGERPAYCDRCQFLPARTGNLGEMGE